MAQENPYQQDFPVNGQPATANQPAAAPARWSNQLANDPYGGAAGAWAKQYYDNPNIDAGAAIQQQLASFRGQYGDAAPADDIGAMTMIATGQTPQAKQQAGNTGPVGNYSSQLNTIQSSPRNDELYNMLMGRATQGLNVNPNDPIIKAQSDAYAANEERSKRGYISDMAEKYGPLANIQGETRMANERVGQRTGTFQAQLMGRELQSRRDEISQALNQMGGMLSEDQRLALQRELGLLDNALRTQLGNADVGLRQQQTDLERALGMGRLGLDSELQASYWDWLRQGGRPS